MALLDYGLIYQAGRLYLTHTIGLPCILQREGRC